MDELITVLSNRRIGYNVSNGNKDLHLGRENSISLSRFLSWDEIQKFSYREHYAVCNL